MNDSIVKQVQKVGREVSENQLLEVVGKDGMVWVSDAAVTAVERANMANAESLKYGVPAKKPNYMYRFSTATHNQDKKVTIGITFSAPTNGEGFVDEAKIRYEKYHLANSILQ